MMTQQSWTRKANALESVKKFIQENVSLEIPVHAVDAYQEEEDGGFFVRVTTDSATRKELQKILGAKAAVIGEKAPDMKEEESDKAHASSAGDAGSRFSTRRLFTAGKNPFRPSGASGQAWIWLESNPGATYAEAKQAGCRMRAISEGIRNGWITVK